MSLVIENKELNKKDSKDMLLIATCEIDDKEKWIYYTENDKVDGHEKIMCKKAKPELIKMKNQIFSCFISAPSGAGKSYKANEIINKLLKENKSINDVFLFTLQPNPDPAYEDLFEKEKIIKMNMLNPEIYDIPLEIFENSICLFDDFDKVEDKIKKMIFLKLEQFLTLGRKLNINVVTVLHETLQYNLTRCIIFESQNVVLFPKSAIKTTNSFLTTYLGFDKEDIAEVKKLKTKSLFIHKSSPQYYVSDDCIKLF